jgi:DNA-binding Lrp family transcriptional regulator
MTSELDILKIVSENPRISQRKISEQTGISLGQVNFLIKKCAKKGLIKIEGQTAKTIKYNITPKGLSEKAERTAQYIKKSYSAVVKLTEAMRETETEYLKQGKALYVTGEDDELMAIAKLALKPESFTYKEGPDVITLNTKDFVV